jgi:hypothetical protein
MSFICLNSLLEGKEDNNTANLRYCKVADISQFRIRRYSAAYLPPVSLSIDRSLKLTDNGTEKTGFMKFSFPFKSKKILKVASLFPLVNVTHFVQDAGPVTKHR